MWPHIWEPNHSSPFNVTAGGPHLLNKMDKADLHAFQILDLLFNV